MSALLPAAELLLRGVLDLRHKHWWHEHWGYLSCTTSQRAVEQVRCTAALSLKCMRVPTIPRVEAGVNVTEVMFLLGDLPLFASLCLQCPRPCGFARRTAQSHGALMLHGCAQSINLGACVARLTLSEEETPAGLALIASLRKRLANLPSDLAADKLWRVRWPTH